MCRRSGSSRALRLQTGIVVKILGNHGIETDRLLQGAKRLEDRQIDVSEYRATLEETDLALAISEVQKLLISLEAAQATYARIQQSSLFDQIR